MNEPLRLLLADDQALVRGALAALLNLEPDITVVAEVGRGDEVVAAAQSTRPDVALIDVEMPGADGIQATRSLLAVLPDIRVLIVTTFGRPGYLRRAMESGASGFVVKDTPARQLADAVRRVHSGLRVVDPVLAAESLAAARAVGGHRAQLPVQCDRQDGGPAPGPRLSASPTRTDGSDAASPW